MSTKAKPQLQCTREYSVFDHHEWNRPLHEDKVLFNSMKEHGFMPSSPVQCKRNGNGTLKVIRGHHRVDVAKRLKLPVWYVIDESNTDIFALEGGLGKWSASDFLRARAASGDTACAKVAAFQKAHGLTLGAASSLLGGEGAGSTNKVRSIRTGTFEVSPDLTHANQVVAITDHCRKHEIRFATSTAFVSAVSMVTYLSTFDKSLFIHRLTVSPARLQKRSTASDYLDEIEALYNFGSKRPIPLAFQAREAAKKRRAAAFHEDTA